MRVALTTTEASNTMINVDQWDAEDIEGESGQGVCYNNFAATSYTLLQNQMEAGDVSSSLLVTPDKTLTGGFFVILVRHHA